MSLSMLLGCQKQKLEQGFVKDHFYLRNKGADMPVVVEGNVSSKTFVIILHGGPGGSAMKFLHLVPAFTDAMEKDYTMVYWDQRGSGMSTGNSKKEDITLEVFSEDLDKLMHLLEHKYGSDIEFFLIGQSFGGMLGSYYLVNYKASNHKIRGWINSGGVHNFDTYHEVVKSYALSFLDTVSHTGFSELKNEALSIVTSVNTLDEKTKANELGAKLQAKAIEVGIAEKRRVKGLNKAAFFGNYNLFLATSNKSRVNEIMFRHIHRVDLTNELRSVTVPALFLYGEYDFVVPPLIGREAFNAYGTIDKKMEILKGGSHNLYATKVERTTSLIKIFIDQH